MVSSVRPIQEMLLDLVWLLHPAKRLRGLIKEQQHGTEITKGLVYLGCRSLIFYQRFAEYLNTLNKVALNSNEYHRFMLLPKFLFKKSKM